MNQEDINKYLEAKKEYQMFVEKFDAEDWRELRNEDYWKCDNIGDSLQKLNYKLVRMRYYNKFGKVMPVLNNK